MSKRFDKFVETVLTDAGWYNGRSVANLVSEWNVKLQRINNMKMFVKAEVALIEFGGLKVKAKEGYSKQTFEIDPTLALGEDDRFDSYSDALKTQLYPLGEVSGGHCFLAVSENGQIFWIMENIFLMGDSFDEAISRMILGFQPTLITV